MSFIFQKDKDIGSANPDVINMFNQKVKNKIPVAQDHKS